MTKFDDRKKADSGVDPTAKTDNPLDSLDLRKTLEAFPENLRAIVAEEIFRALTRTLHSDKLAPKGIDSSIADKAVAPLIRDSKQFRAVPAKKKAEYVQGLTESGTITARIVKKSKLLESQLEQGQAREKATLLHIERNMMRMRGKSREEAITADNAAPCIINMTDIATLDQQFDEALATSSIRMEQDDSQAYKFAEQMQSKHHLQLVLDEDGRITRIQGDKEIEMAGRTVVGSIAPLSYDKIKKRLAQASVKNVPMLGSSDQSSSEYIGNTVLTPNQFAGWIQPYIENELKDGNALVTCDTNSSGADYYVVEGIIGKSLSLADDNAIELL